MYSLCVSAVRGRLLDCTSGTSIMISIVPVSSSSSIQSSSSAQPLLKLRLFSLFTTIWILRWMTMRDFKIFSLWLCMNNCRGCWDPSSLRCWAANPSANQPSLNHFTHPMRIPMFLPYSTSLIMSSMKLSHDRDSYIRRSSNTDSTLDWCCLDREPFILSNTKWKKWRAMAGGRFLLRSLPKHRTMRMAS